MSPAPRRSVCVSSAGRTDFSADGIVGGLAESTQALFRILRRVARASLPVLVHGESGTGKELVARAIHRHGPRGARPLIAESCAALSEGLLESELFGHVRGAFTGAFGDRPGLFEQASGGTLFLDEVGETTPSMQAKLLRVLEQGEVRRVGGSQTIPIDVCVVAATSRNLSAMVEEGTFREDLYYRISAIPVEVPPLRERLDDLPLLLDHFLGQAKSCVRHRFDSTAVQRLRDHDWPGNIRELRNVVERAVLFATGEVLSAETIQLDMPRSSTMRRSETVLARQKDLVVYLQANGDIRNSEYSQLFGVSRTTGWRDLMAMIEDGVITANGTGRGTVYVLNPLHST